MATVAIVGRPNVGKSTLFNRLTENRQAIVHDEPGVTRDRLYGWVNWNGRDFELIDTGGFVPRSENLFEKAIREQVTIAIEETDLILFVVDVHTGITQLDQEVADMLRSVDKPVIVIANKSDNEEKKWGASEFYALGLGEVFAMSSINGTGSGDLLDELVNLLPEDPVEIDDDYIRVAIIGKPNVGKSSLVNKLLGKERLIVSDISGTTRDSIDSKIEHAGEKIILIDTAGLRRKSKIKENVEFYSIMRTERSVRECDMAVMMIDGSEDLDAQDIRVLKLAEELNKGILLLVNKWDLVEKETNTARDLERGIKERLQTLAYIPVLFVSALSGQRVHKVLDEVLKVAKERNKKVGTSELNKWLERVTLEHHPPSWRGNYVKIKYGTQIRSAPPVFTFFCNHPEGIEEAYSRYLANKLRESFGFEGVPLNLTFRRK